MYTKNCLCIFHVNTSIESTGERIVKDSDGIVDINELHEALKQNDKFVVICLHVTNSPILDEQYYMCTGKLAGVKDTYVFTSHTRTARGAYVREMIMAFNNENEENQIHVKYYDE